MSYYLPQAGDYATGGYAGDPGFFSSAWKVIKSIGKKVLPAIIGGPVGLAVGLGASMVPRLPGPARPPVPGPRGPMPIPFPIPWNGGGAAPAAGKCLPGPPRPDAGLSDANQRMLPGRLSP